MVAALDRKHHRRVALKVLRPEFTAGVGADRFRREIRLVAGLTHPHIVPLHDSGEADGLFYYVMPLMEGENLRTVLERGGRLPMDRVVQIAVEVAGALAYAHGRGIVHRDVKPANVLLTGGHSLLADFGIAHVMDAVTLSLTAEGRTVGTPLYVSPEQLSEDRPLDGRADLYSLGCTVYEMLSGRPPFGGRTTAAVLAGHLAGSAAPLVTLRPDVDARVAAVVARAMARDPEDRFPDAETFAAALRRAHREAVGAGPSRVRGKEPPGSGATSSDDLEALERHLAAVMFTDLEGYTAMMQRDERDALKARALHRKGVEEVGTAFGGRVLQYFGDGSLSVFPSAVQAVRAAVDLQRRARAGKLPLRIGIHVGDIAYDAQGAYGDAVNVAARIESLCPGGGILVSERVAEELRNHPDLATEPLGTVELKNVREPMELHAIVSDDLPVPVLDAPGPEGSSALSGRGLAHLAASLGRPPYRTRAIGREDREPHLVGRDGELEVLQTWLEAAEEGRGGAAFLSGGRGVGKSRLAEAVAEAALQRGWWVALGRSYPAARRVPFAHFADALQPALRELSGADRSALAPGAEDILRHVFPALGPPVDGLGLRFSEPDELQTRIFWHLSTLLGKLGRRAPLLLILEDAQWADPSSLELFHFVARQCAGERIAVLCVYAEPEPHQERALRGIAQSLASLVRVVSLKLEPLSADAAVEMAGQLLGMAGPEIEALAKRLHRWTGGNAFFMEGILRQLLDSEGPEAIRARGIGQGDVELELPRSVREAVLERVARIGESSRGLVEIMAVMGRRTTHDTLSALVDMPGEALVDALEELQRYRVIDEVDLGRATAYDFVHPLIGDALRSELSLARRRSLHHRIGEKLEEHLGPVAPDHPDELAYHFARAHPGQAGEKAVRYLVAAGRRALARYANHEAADYFQDALDRIDAGPLEKGVVGGASDSGDRARIIEGLAKARTRLGQHEEAVRMWKRALGVRRGNGDRRGEARIHREIGLMHLWSDHLDEALEELGTGVEAARESGDEPLVAVIRLAESLCHQHAGRPEEASRAAESAMEIARSSGDRALLARAHSALLRLQIWTGELKNVRMHGEEALRLARACGDQAVAFWSHWALAVAEGLFGNIERTKPRIAEARRIADEVGSPILGLWTDEFTVEQCYSTGDWDRGTEVGGQAIRLARDLKQKTVLPRLLVWTALIHIGRGEYDRARELTDEAWEVSGAGGAAAGRTGLDLHTVVPAHIGRAAWACALGDWDEAIRVGELGAELAARSGYVVWGLHRLLPILAEAHIHARNLDRARSVAEGMRNLSQNIGHDLGLAWAHACTAILTWLEGDVEKGARQLEAAADRLDAIPMIWEAARLRRQAAGRLGEIGDIRASVAQLDRVHATCVRLGARGELTKVEEMYKELGEDPPDRRSDQA